MQKPLLITIGVLLTGLAFLGIFLPLLPTTPLLLLALACFANSSERFHNWLINNRTFGPLIKDWHEKRSIPRKAKVYAIIMIFISGMISILSVNTIFLRLLVIGILIIPIVVIIKIKTTETL
jgi:uncharacterized membrane protein YbaN (DUF454 family)